MAMHSASATFRMSSRELSAAPVMGSVLPPRHPPQVQSAYAQVHPPQVQSAGALIHPPSVQSAGALVPGGFSVCLYSAVTLINDRRRV